MGLVVGYEVLGGGGLVEDGLFCDVVVGVVVGELLVVD